MPETNNKERINLVTNNIMNITNIVNNLPNYLNTADANALNIDILNGKTAYVDGTKITGTMNNQGDVTIDPTTSSQLYNGGYYNSISINAVTSSIDPNITANNIANGINILGILGTFEGGTNTQDANALASDIAINKTAYVNGTKITGSLEDRRTGIFAVPVGSITNVYIEGQLSSIQFEGPGSTIGDLIIGSGSTIASSISKGLLANALNINNNTLPVGVNILDIEGSYTSDANALNNQILENYTAYVNGTKLTGTYVPVMNVDEYNNCLNITNNILA